MQLPGGACFLASLSLLLFGRNDCHDDQRDSFYGGLDRELDKFQKSLIRHIVENTALDPKENDEEIRNLATAILDEADRRLKNGDNLNSKHQEHFSYSSILQGRGIKPEFVADLYQNLLKVHNLYAKDLTKIRDEDVNGDGQQKEHTKTHIKREINEAQVEEQYIDTSRQKKDIAESLVWDHDYGQQKKTVVGGNNEQIATVNIDNTPDITTEIVNKARNLLLEPNLYVGKEENQTHYAAHYHSKVEPPQEIVTSSKIDRTGLDKLSFIAVIAACCVAGIAGILLASFCWYKLRSETKEFNDNNNEFKSNSMGTFGKGKSMDEAKLARGAEVFHYLHAKKQIKQMEDRSCMKTSGRTGVSINESTDDEDEEEEDTVYECPGLAPPGDMRVVNPLFSDTENHYSDGPSTQSTPSPPLEEKE